MTKGVIMKKTPVTIKELDVQPISDEDLKAFPNVAGAGESDVWECTCNSSVWTCYSWVDQ